MTPAVIKIARKGASIGVLGMEFDITHWFLLMTYLVFPSLSIKIFSTYSCDEKFEDGTSYLKADMTIDCLGDEHKYYELIGYGLILLYPVGIPLMYLCSIGLYTKIVRERAPRSRLS